jgi:ribosomal protein L11 methyltransferase
VPESGPNWIEVSVEADAEAVEAVSELLARFGYNDGVAIDEPYRQDEDGDNLEIDPTRPVRVRTWLPVAPQFEERKAAIDEALWHLGRIGSVQPAVYSERADEDWANAWKEHFPILRIGTRFVVRPSWREYSATADDRVIHLDPGMAFGTGLHPSTEMCMLFMEEMDLCGRQVLDVGAGSGILAIGAIRSGAERAVAVEIDAVAARSLAENVSLNGMESVIDVVVGDIRDALEPELRFPVVFANLIARILADHAEAIARHVASPGVIVASGVIEERERMVVDAFSGLGFHVADRRLAGDWVALRLERT